MPPDFQRAGRWVALDSMRGVAALLVVLYHLRWDWHGYGLVPIRHGFYAVDFFFVLSGFVIAATYGAMRTPADLVGFVIKRAGRLLPLHFAVLTAFVALELAFAVADRLGLPVGRPIFSGFTGAAPLLAQATVTFGLIPGLDWLWNHPSWSISVEFWAYILFGLTVVTLRSGRHLLWSILACLGLIVMSRTPEGLATTSGLAFFRCLLSFFLGTLVHAAYTALRERGVRFGLRAQLAALAAAVAVLALPATTGWSLVIPFIFAVLVLCLAFDEGGAARALGARPLVRLGELSFSIYLVHVPIWFAVEGVLRLGAGAGATWLLPDAGPKIPTMVSPFGSAFKADALMLAYLGLVVAVSAWTYKRIEVPARIWSRRVADLTGPHGRGVVNPPKDAPAPRVGPWAALVSRRLLRGTSLTAGGSAMISDPLAGNTITSSASPTPSFPRPAET